MDTNKIPVGISTLYTTGFSVSSGKVDMASTLAFISFNTSFISAPISTSALTLPRPSLDVDLIFFMPFVSCIASSIFITTPSSTSSGAAPK